MRKVLTAAVLTLGSLTLAQTALAQSAPNIDITSAGKVYKSYLAVPPGTGKKPAVILIHSYNGMEQGYRDLADEMARAGYVTLVVGWQTFEKEPSDAVVKALVEDGLKSLATRPDVNIAKVGLTGFCAGGRYTMLLLPQMPEFKAGVAWYGFPEQGGTAAKPKAPQDFIGQLNRPLMIIHGTKDQASPINTIYSYAQKLDAANKPFKLAVYQGEPHSFLLKDSKIADTFASRDARKAMLNYFGDTLK